MKSSILLFPLLIAAAPSLAKADALHDNMVFEYQPTNPPPPPAENSLEKKTLAFGKVGQDWITVGAGFAHDFSGSGAGDVHVAWSTFVIEDVEFSLELAGWYFSQKGTDALGINPQFVFRWHFYTSEDKKWTLFAEGGIGLLFATDNVPDGGTSVDFTPRAGGGFTRQLTDDGLRLQVGIRWAHISNARFNGDSRNPSRDSVMLFAGLIFPF